MGGSRLSCNRTMSASRNVCWPTSPAPTSAVVRKQHSGYTVKIAWEKLTRAAGGDEVLRALGCMAERYESIRSAAECLFIFPINQYVR
jgi:hypothetical protein